MVQVPAVRNVSAPVGVMVHTLRVDDVKVGTSPESEVAVSVGEVPKFWAPGLLKVTVCVALGVMELEDAEAGPVPATLSAVTVKVYAWPLVGPVNATDAWVSPAMAVPMVGAPGTMALTVKDRLTCVAGR